MITIRPGSSADTEAIYQVLRASWFAAYEGIVATEIIDRVTAPTAALPPPPWRRTIVAEAAPSVREPGERGSAEGEPAVAPAGGVVGFASYGPERDVVAPRPHPLTQRGEAGQVAELYAIYVDPGWWSTGTGRSLMDEVLTATRADRYERIVLWVLEKNARARRFYECAGFEADGGSNVMLELGGVTEVRYGMPL
jgi:GNAT superfamily N-acetyltransferase